MSHTTIPTSSRARRATLGDQLRRHALHNPDRRRSSPTEAPNDEGRRTLTYRELDERVQPPGASLSARGVVKGDVVALMGRNTPESIVAFWAAAKLGAAVTGVNFTFTAREIHYQISHCGGQGDRREDEFTDRVDAIDEPLPDLELRIVNDAFADTAPAVAAAQRADRRPARTSIRRTTSTRTRSGSSPTRAARPACPRPSRSPSATTSCR